MDPEAYPRVEALYKPGCEDHGRGQSGDFGRLCIILLADPQGGGGPAGYEELPGVEGGLLTRRADGVVSRVEFWDADRPLDLTGLPHSEEIRKLLEANGLTTLGSVGVLRRRARATTVRLLDTVLPRRRWMV